MDDDKIKKKILQTYFFMANKSYLNRFYLLSISIQLKHKKNHISGIFLSLFLTFVCVSVQCIYFFQHILSLISFRKRKKKS